MKISVCIPVYNFEIENLVFSLKKEIDKFQLNAEIILIDDASSENFVRINEPLKKVVNQFIFLEKNIGRSAIRNLFLNYASGDYMLFLDCDAQIISEKFIKNYIDFLEKNTTAEVVFGGFEIAKAEPLNLRQKFSLEREIIQKKEGEFNPYNSFRSINFLIKNKVFKKNLFNESLKNYGYEDYLFSKKLEIEKIEIFHIENPVLHADNETTEEFLTKTRIGICNLHKIRNENPSFVKDMKIIKVYYFLEKKKLLPAFILFYKLSKPFLKANLLKKNPKLMYFDIYRLGLLAELSK